MTPSKTLASLSSLASAALLSACTTYVPVPTVLEQPTVSQPKVVLTEQTSVTGTASPAFNTLPPAPSPSQAEPVIQPVVPGVVEIRPTAASKILACKAPAKAPARAKAPVRAKNTKPVTAPCARK